MSLFPCQRTKSPVQHPLPELPERHFISRATRRKFHCVTACLSLVPVALLLNPLRMSEPIEASPPKPYQAQRGSLTVLPQNLEADQPQEPTPPTPDVAAEPPRSQASPVSPEPPGETSQTSEPIVSEPRITQSNVASTPVVQETSPGAPNTVVETLLAEYARTWEGLGNGQTDGDGEASPAYVFSTMDSYLQLLQERGVLIAFNRKTEVRFRLGGSLNPKQYKETHLKSWLDLPGYSKRVSLLPPTNPLVSALRTRFLREHPEWTAANTMLVVAIPESLDAAILNAQLAACERHQIRPTARVVTIGDLSAESGRVSYVVRAVQDLSATNRAATR